MKAVVVELNNNKAAVLSDNGCIVTVNNKNYTIGQVIQIKSQKFDIKKKVAAFAASAAAIVVLGTGTWAYASPYSYVSVDVNPSLEFTLNRFDRVIKVNAVNDDGEAILSEISLDDLKNETIQNAISKTVEQITEAGYFNGEAEGGIVIATSSDDTDKADELAEELHASAEKETVDNGDAVNVEAFSVGKDRVQEARALGVTPGKLNLVEKLIKAAGDSEAINKEEWLNKPVKEIMKATNEYTQADKDAKEAEDEGTKDAASEDKKDSLDNEDSNGQEENNELSESDEQSDKENKQKALEKAQKEIEKATNSSKKAEEKAQEEKEKAERKSNKPHKKVEKAEVRTDKQELDASNEEIERAKDDMEKAQEQAKEASEKALEKAQKETEKAKEKALEDANDESKVEPEIRDESSRYNSNPQKNEEVKDNSNGNGTHSVNSGNGIGNDNED